MNRVSCTYICFVYLAQSDRVEICRQTVCTSEKETLSYISEVLFALNIGQSLTDKKSDLQSQISLPIKERYTNSLFSQSDRLEI